MSTASAAVIARLATLAQLGRYEGGIDRGLASAPERAAREHFAAWARASGYALTQDCVGNLFARRAGTKPGALPILTGSHLDTVKTGGAYDGAYGVVGALGALEELDARGSQTRHPIEAVAWAGEEGSRFSLGCLGSSVFAHLAESDAVLALVDDDGMTLREALAGGSGLLPEVPLRAESATAGYLELHIEQGPIMESVGARLGIVTAIAGQRRYRVQIEGTSGHAGTVPMRGRADALCAAAELVLALEAAALQLGECVVTVGRITVEPGGTNVIPARAIFTVDARSPDERRVSAIESALFGAIGSTSRRGVRVSVDALEAREPVPMDAGLRAAVRRAADASGERVIDVPSGAGHDAMCIAKIAPAAMIFVPSIGGASHVGEERTSEADLELGVLTLADALLEVDRALDGEARG